MSQFNLDATSLGQSLTGPQKLAVKIALYQLQLNERLAAIKFWGKIIGTETDYLIAVSESIDQSINRTFYWSHNNGVTFARFEPLDEFVNKLAPHINGMFTGNPALKHRDPTQPRRRNEDGEVIESDEEEEQPEEGDDDAPKQPKPRKLSELERLHWTVQTIDHDTTLVASGRYHLTPTGDISLNQSFNGLNTSQLKDLQSFVHWRNSESRDAAVRVRKQRTTNCVDFLDCVEPSIKQNKPQEWTLHTDPSSMNVSIRSLVWMGYELTAEAGNQSINQSYFGLGERNRDLPFML